MLEQPVCKLQKVSRVYLFIKRLLRQYHVSVNSRILQNRTVAISSMERARQLQAIEWNTRITTHNSDRCRGYISIQLAQSGRGISVAIEGVYSCIVTIVTVLLEQLQNTIQWHVMPTVTLFISM